MKTRRKNYLTLALLLLLLMVLGCEHEEPGTRSASESFLSKIKDIGFSGNMIEEHEDYFIVEEDIVLYKKDLDALDHEGPSL